MVWTLMDFKFNPFPSFPQVRLLTPYMTLQKLYPASLNLSTAASYAIYAGLTPG